MSCYTLMSWQSSLWTQAGEVESYVPACDLVHQGDSNAQARFRRRKVAGTLRGERE